MPFPVACYPKMSRPSNGASFVGALDDYTTALAGVWSVARRLLSSYTGSLIRIRRDSDDAEQDIGFDADGNLDTAAITSFVGANSAFVTSIYDQSGSAYNASQAVALSQPKIVNAGTLLTLSGKPTMVLDGTASTLNIATLQTTGVRSYSCVMQSTGAVWNNYGAPIGNTSGFITSRLALTNLFNTDWYDGGSIPVGVRRNGVALTTPFNTAPINSPLVLGVDCHVSTDPQATNIGATEGLYFLAASISEIVAWASVADRTDFEANQKALIGL